jgi:glycosyltransferase involved in cell wall biosynthesis
VSGLLSAFAQVAARTKGAVYLRLAGDGDLEELRLRIETAGLSEGQARVSGPHTEIEISGLMQKCHAFLLPSHYENEPVVLLEAQACGRPCIATRTGGIPEILADPNCGELVEVGDDPGLVIAMLKMLENYSDYDRQLIRELAVARCSESAVLNRLEKIYEECLQ